MFICIAGKNDISVNVLEYLLERKNDRYELGIVCNQNESGIDSWQKSLRCFAEKRNVKEYTLQEMYGIRELLFLSLEFDKIIDPDKFVDARLFNIHFSLLPQYRGMYTSALPILHGNNKSGVTLHKIDSGIDTGDIIAQRTITLEEDDTSRDLYFRCIKEGTELVIQNIDKLINGDFVAWPQKKEGATYFGRDEIDYSNLKIDLNRTAEQVKNQIRAFYFPEYQYPKVYGKNIRKAVITDRRSKKKPGEIIEETDGYIIVSTIDYDVILQYEIDKQNCDNKNY